MNEVDFARLSREMSTGDLVLFYKERLVTDSPCVTDPNGYRSLVAGAIAAGWVLRFVDPAKPLLIYRTDNTPALGIDFFQDALYSAQPAITAGSFVIVSSHDSAKLDARPWFLYLERVVGQKLQTETELFDMYSAGALGAVYTEQTLCDAGLLEWIQAHHSLLDSPALDHIGATRDVWEGHNVYSFS